MDYTGTALFDSVVFSPMNRVGHWLLVQGGRVIQLQLQLKLALEQSTCLADIVS
jgi:hypothetical protein